MRPDSLSPNPAAIGAGLYQKGIKVSTTLGADCARVLDRSGGAGSAPACGRHGSAEN
jgi:hypothetical protein